MKTKFLNGLNWLLMANLFFVLLSFMWFAVALVGRSMNVALGFDLWYRLWQPLFQPAIGILMLGAILSGVASWITKRFWPNDRQSQV